MCGIVGLYDRSLSGDQKIQHIRQMMDSINHRGPDSRGYWMDNDHDLILGHVRLSILDLSSNGSQPMMSNTQRYVISYNGEIYNFVKIKKELEEIGCKFRSTSDTEVILNALEYWGINKTITKLEGMFAIALWDRRNHQLILIRDRAGEKPLFYGVDKNIFFFFF